MEESATYIKDILIKWNLQHLVQIFLDEEFDIDSFQTLKYEVLRDILPKAGQRNVFWNKYQAEFHKEKSATRSASSLSTNISNYEISQSFLENFTIVPETGDITDTNVETHITDITLQNNSIDLDSSIIIAAQSAQNFSNKLEDYLLCANGQIVKRYYLKHNKLENKERNLLANLVIQKEFESSRNNIKNFKITKERFIELANEIVKIFPTEIASIYYIPYLKNPRRLAGGKLYECYNRLKKNFRETQVYPNDKTIENDGILINEKDLKEKLAFLKSCFLPIQKVNSYWEDTFNFRFSSLKSSSPPTIQEYFDNCKALTADKGYLLLSADFDLLYPSQSNRMFTHWPEINLKLIKLAEYKKITAENIVGLSGENKEYLGFLLLPYFLGTSTYMKKTSKQGKRLKYTKNEIVNSFILHIKDANLVQEEIEGIKTILQKRKETLQPSVIVAGEDLSSIRTTYIAVNNVLWSTESILTGIDFCFKSFFALNAKYPEASNVIWTFIQRYLYGIQLDTDKLPIAISTLISDLNSF